jgi:hypothetical protein
MKAGSFAGVIVLAILGGACDGFIGGDGDGSEPPIAGESSIGASDVRRLSQNEYAASLRDLFGDAAIDAVSAALDQVPLEDGSEGFSTMELSVSAQHVDGYFALADALSDYYATDPSRLAPIDPCFGDAAFGDACVEGFITAFGKRVFRRPVAAGEAATMMDLYHQGTALSTADGLRLVLLYLLQAPPFLYRLELDGAPLAELTEVYELSPWELATRLSYFAWGTTPDEELLAAAESGALGGDDYTAQVERLFASERVRGQVGRFFGEWLGTDALPQVQQPEEFLDGIDGTGLAADMQAEIARYVEHHVFVAEGGYGELMTSNAVFPVSDALAALYGTSASADAPVAIDDGTRNGLLTRAALLVGSGVSTHPIQRGAHIRRLLLCEALEPPDPADFPPNSIVAPPFDESKTARERWTEQTASGPCATCHSLINPFGFALENFDTIGRYRQSETIFDPESGAEVNQLPIDSVVTVPIDGSVEVAGGAGLGAALATSPTALRCFARQWFRYATGREEGQDDAEVLAALRDTIAEGTMIAMLKRLALTPQFKLRRIVP